MKTKNTDIELKGIKIKPIRNKEGKILNDAEIIDMALDTINNYTETEGNAPPIDGRFKQWLEEAKEFVEKGGSIVKYKRETISKTIPDYKMLKNVN